MFDYQRVSPSTLHSPNIDFPRFFNSIQHRDAKEPIGTLGSSSHPDCHPGVNGDNVHEYIYIYMILSLLIWFLSSYLHIWSIIKTVCLCLEFRSYDDITILSLYYIITYFKWYYILSSGYSSYYTMIIATSLSSLLSFNIDILYEVWFNILVITLW